LDTLLDKIQFTYDVPTLKSAVEEYDKFNVEGAGSDPAVTIYVGLYNSADGQLWQVQKAVQAEQDRIKPPVSPEARIPDLGLGKTADGARRVCRGTQFNASGAPLGPPDGRAQMLAAEFCALTAAL